MPIFAPGRSTASARILRRTAGKFACLLPGSDETRRAWNGMGARGSSTRPSGLAQTLDHVGMVFRPHPRHAPSYIHVEGGGRDFLQRFLRFLGSSDLSE